MEMGNIYDVYSQPIVKIIGPCCKTLVLFWKNITLHEASMAGQT